MGADPDAGDVRRLVATVALCLLAAGLLVGFAVRFDGTPVYPDADAIDANYADRVGDRVHLWGTVVGDEDGETVIAADDLRLRVTDPPPSAVERGDQVQVEGRLRPDRRLETRSYDVITGGERVRLYAVSAVGGLVAAGAFLRRFRLDRERWVFVPR